LDLWLAILENTVECTPLLFNLVPAAIGLLEFGTETLKRVLRIIESYILLVPEMIVQVLFCILLSLVRFYFYTFIDIAFYIVVSSHIQFPSWTHLLDYLGT
jgi:hypothetical protein